MNLREAIQFSPIVKAIPSKLYIQLHYLFTFKKLLNLKNPKGFNEKLQWLKLYDHNPLYSMLVDKYLVKNYVAERIGQEHVVPLLGVWDNFDEIDFDKLPNQFVLKCNHDSGGYVVCKDKKDFNKKNAKKIINRVLHRNYYYAEREWSYKNVKPKIIAEKYIDSLGKPESIEYKLTCYDGKVKMITVCSGIAHSSFDVRFNNHYDRNFKPLDFYVFYKKSKKEVVLPKQINEIIEYAEKLSQGIPQVRVDFYIHDDIVYFGEMTFYTWGGWCKFNPPEWNEILGNWITLPTKN